MMCYMDADVVASLRAKFDAVLPHLDERQQRLVMAGEARSLGHGGIAAVASAIGASRSRISAGVAELESGQAPLGRTRRVGGGLHLPGLLALTQGRRSPEFTADPGVFWVVKVMDPGVVVLLLLVAGVGLLRRPGRPGVLRYAVTGWSTMLGAAVVGVAVVMMIQGCPRRLCGDGCGV